MTIPEGVSASAWEKASKLWEEFACNDTEAIARAMDAATKAAKAEAYEEAANVCIKISERYAQVAKDLPADHYKVPYRLHRQGASSECAVAIRKLGSE